MILFCVLYPELNNSDEERYVKSLWQRNKWTILVWWGRLEGGPPGVEGRLEGGPGRQLLPVQYL